MKKTTLLAAMLFAFVPIAIAQCNEVSLPYQENFDTVELPELPECTYSVKQMFAGNDWDTVVAPNSNFSGNVGHYNTNSVEGFSMYCYYFTRQVQFTAGMAYKVSYKYAHEGETPIDRFSTIIYISPTSKIDISSHEAVSGTDAINHSSELFTVPTTGSYSLYFYVESTGNQGILYLDDIKIEEMGVMGTENTELAGLTYYPNPVKDMLTISSITALESLDLYNTTGQLLLSQLPTDQISIMNFESLASGIYFIQAKSQSATKTIQIMKQ